MKKSSFEDIAREVEQEAPLLARIRRLNSNPVPMSGAPDHAPDSLAHYTAAIQFPSAGSDHTAFGGAQRPFLSRLLQAGRWSAAASIAGIMMFGLFTFVHEPVLEAAPLTMDETLLYLEDNIDEFDAEQLLEAIQMDPSILEEEPRASNKNIIDSL